MAQYSSSRAGLYRSLPPALFCNNTFNPGPLFSTLLLHFLYPIIINGVHNKPFKTLASFQDTLVFLLVFLGPDAGDNLWALPVLRPVTAN